MNEQHIEPELTIGEIVKLYMSHWRMFLVFSLGLFGLSVLVYIVKVPYVASSTIVINDSQNSSLQAFSSQFFGLSKSVQESKKGNSLLAKHIEYLKTREFYELLLRRLEVRGLSPKITMEEKEGFETFKSKYLSDLSTEDKKVALLQTLDRWTKATLDSDFEIKVAAVTANKAMSLFISNTASELAAELLKQRELDEIQRVEEFMAKQKEDADQKLVSISKQLAEMQNKDGNVLPLASANKMGDYVSDLLVRANEIKLKIAENKRMIEYLNNGRSAQQRESALYGVGGRVEGLKIENSMLQEKLGQVQASIDRLKKESKSLPFEAAMVEDLKKKSELEFNRYKELSSGLAKLDAQKLSIDTRFEVLERARWETTSPQIGLLSLGLLSLLLSQFMGSLIIYFRYLWNPHVVTAQASRNLVIFDNHSVDPRVIIENSKIKFSLKKPESKNESEQGAEQANANVAAWNVLNVGQGTDVTQ